MKEIAEKAKALAEIVPDDGSPLATLFHQFAKLAKELADKDTEG